MHSITQSTSTANFKSYDISSSSSGSADQHQIQYSKKTNPTSPTSTPTNDKKNNGASAQFMTTCWRKISSNGTSHFVETKITKPRRNRIISEKEMLQVLHLSQIQACKQLDCSLSTLKRRFYELKDGFGLERWPQYFFEIRHLPIFNKLYPMSLQFILNDD